MSVCGVCHTELAEVVCEKSSLLARPSHINNDSGPRLQDPQAFRLADVRRGSRCDEKTCKSELDRFARKGIDPGLAEIISSREGKAALPSLLVP
ncbi:MAG: hypothetical protein WBQ11_10875, partial [Isosphaeraceae bacterium]